jgi:hypothetical protein
MSQAAKRNTGNSGFPLSSIVLFAMFLGLGLALFNSQGKTPAYMARVKPQTRDLCMANSKVDSRRNFAGVIFGGEAGRLVALEDCVRELEPDALAFTSLRK